MTSHTLGNLQSDDVFNTLITDHEYCKMDFEKIENMLLEVEASWGAGGTTAKGRTLEDLSVYLLSCVEPFSVTYDEHTSMNQLDGFIEVLAHRGHNPFLQSLGQYFLAECKNEDGSVDINHVQKVGSIMDLHHMAFSIIFSRRKLTGAGKYEDAQAYVISQMHGKGRRIISITYADLQFMNNTKRNFLTFLREKNREATLADPKSNSLTTEIRKITELYKQELLSPAQFERSKDLLLQAYGETSVN